MTPLDGGRPMTPLDVIAETIDVGGIEAARSAAEVLRRLPQNAGKQDEELIRDTMTAAGWRFVRHRERWVWPVDATETEQPRTLARAVILAAAARTVSRMREAGEY